MNSDCLSCKILSGKLTTPGGIIYETESFFLAHAIDTPIPGFIVLASKRHIESIADMDDTQTKELGPLLRKVTKTLRNVVSPERIYCCSVGENISHLHFYLFPRYEYMAGFEHGVAIFPIAVRKAKAEFTMDEKMYEILEVVEIIKHELHKY